MWKLFVFVLSFVVFAMAQETVDDFYSYAVTDIHGETVSLEKFRGTVSLVVNVASRCGFTDSHYRALQRLYAILGYGGKFNVLAFPCNQFGGQEPFENEDIHHFATLNYGVEFPMFAKTDIVGDDAVPVYKSLINQSSVHPDWNFYKYLVDPNGKVINAWGPKVTVESIFDEIQAAVNSAKEVAANITVSEAEESKVPPKEEL